MRIALFTETYFPFISGVVTHVQTLKETLESCGHEVLIVTTSPKAACHYIKDGILYCPAIPLKRIYGYGVANPLNLQRLRIIQDFNPDILHIHTEFSMGIFGLFAARKLKKPIVYTLHTMYDDYMFYIAPERFHKMVRPGAHIYLRKVAKRATEIIGPSFKVVEYLRRCGVERHINIVPNTVDLSDFLPENVKSSEIQAVKEKLGITPQDTALCFVGRLGKEKSIDVLIDWFAENFKNQLQYKLFIIGDGPEKKALQQQIDTLQINKQITLLGRIEHNQLPPYYHACDVFATASLSEMNSIAMLEATASGLYVLQRLDVFNKDQIVPNVNGNLFNTSAEFANLVQEQGNLSLQEKQLRREKVTAHSQKYGKAEFIRSVLNIYDRAILKYNAVKKK